MNEQGATLAKNFVKPSYVDGGTDAIGSVQNVCTSILAQRRLPTEGLNDAAIQLILAHLAQMDSNNFLSHVGAGEREGRVFSTLVKQRHFHMTHGVGRSGDLVADQPKAAGSSLLGKMTMLFALDIIRAMGAVMAEGTLVVPMATGMTMSLVLQALEARRRKLYCGSTAAAGHRAQHADPSPAAPAVRERGVVIWSRIDQKTCLKCIYTTGLSCRVVELKPVDPNGEKGLKKKRDKKKQKKDCNEEGQEAGETTGAGKEGGGAKQESGGCSPAGTTDGDTVPTGFLGTNIAALEAAINEVGVENITCVFTTTSCFAPRTPDDVLSVARLCQKFNVPHLVNNAYGVQSRVIMKRLNTAMTHGRVDAFVQSTDKNFLVPVGGSVVASSDKTLLKEIGALYAGRASGAPVTDLFITLLSMGRSGYIGLVESREEILRQFREKLGAFASSIGEEIRWGDGNDISFVMTLFQFTTDQAGRLAARLFKQAVTGPRVVCPQVISTTAPTVGSENVNDTMTQSLVPPATQLCGHSFSYYGSHSNENELSKKPYLAVACGIGMSVADVDGFIAKLSQACFSIYPELKKRVGK